MALFDRRKFLQQAGTVAALSYFQSSAKAQAAHPMPSFLPIEFGSEKQVSCDGSFMDAGYGLASGTAQQQSRDDSIFMPRGVELYTGCPELSEAAGIFPETPTDGIMMGGYRTLLEDGGKFRLWYERNVPLETSDEEARICYPESDDGVVWKKPNLGILEYRASKDNNLDSSRGHGSRIFIDPTAKAPERYEMVHLDKVPLQVVNGKQRNAIPFARYRQTAVVSAGRSPRTSPVRNCLLIRGASKVRVSPSKLRRKAATQFRFTPWRSAMASMGSNCGDQ